MTKLSTYQKRIGSQNGEAGIIRHIFDVIGDGGKQLVEIGIGSECNSANLLNNYGWYGWLFDGNMVEVFKATVRWINCKPITAFLTVENVNDVMEKAGVPDSVDMFSLDIDGNDYWIWKEMSLDSRMVVMEYNASFGPEESITIKYIPTFDRMDVGNTKYHGASLTALTKLGKTKGYSLVGCEGSGINAFYIKKELLQGDLEEVSPQDAYESHRSRGPWKVALKKMREVQVLVEV